MADVPKLAPAKPYEGVPQTKAIAHVLRKFALAKLIYVHMGDDPRLPQVRAKRSWSRIQGELHEVVEISVMLNKSGFGASLEHSAEAIIERDRLRKVLVEALLEAGWTVDRGSGSLFVYGPGAHQWIDREKKRQEEMKRVRADEERLLDGQRAALREALKSCGMPMSVIRSGGYSHSLPDLCVVLTPKQLGDLILNVRSSQEARKP